MRLTRIATPLTLLLAASAAYGAAHGEFPGLSNLIRDSQAIVVASIESAPKTPRTDSSRSKAVQKVRVLYSIEGNFKPQDEIDVALDIEILFPARTYLQVADYPLYERYVLFIGPGSLSPDGYGLVNAQGGAFWIPREADLAVLGAGDVRGNLEVLLSAVLTYARSREQALNERVEEYLSQEPQR